MRNHLIIQLFVLCFLLVASHAKVYFKETFDDGWESRWIESKHKGSEAGPWKHTAGEFYGDAIVNKGIKTGEDARFYQVSAKIDEFSNKGKDLVLQYSVKHEQNIDCGGGYIKILPAPLDQKDFNGDSNYNIMFGPDICGSSTRKVHAIFNYKGKNHLINKNVPCETDQYTHVYTLVVHPDNTYEIEIDGQKKQSGSLKDDWDMLPAKKIKDPSKSKPSDWVDTAKIPDPEAKKPAGWDEIPAEIVDPEASKPADWDDELDGEWEAPTIRNPEFKGEWSAPMIDNPDYKGPWIHPEIDNPDWYDDDTLYSYTSNAYVGFEIWQVKAGTIFDNIMVTDDKKEADAFREATYTKTIEKEKDAKKKKDDAEAAERAAAAAASDDAEDKDEL